ncbi:VCBS domain-containing protein, partial [bacterium]|nr:VCBS domain-containing protein [bacterium]
TFNTNATIGGSSSSTLSGSYEYSVINSKNNINYTYSGNLSSNNTTFYYDFVTPGKYTVTVTYKVNGTNNTVLTQTETYYVIYNDLTISARTLNPNLGTTDTLSVNNDQVYSSGSNPTYQ